MPPRVSGILTVKRLWNGVAVWPAGRESIPCRSPPHRRVVARHWLVRVPLTVLTVDTLILAVDPFRAAETSDLMN
jgi:hypothetical protein